MIKAYPYNNGSYRLFGERSSDTYNIKDQIKNVGGVWNKEIKQWVVTENCLQELKDKKIIAITKMAMALVEKHCHEEQQQIFATEEEVERGYVLIGCAMCDSLGCKDKVKIIKEIKNE